MTPQLLTVDDVARILRVRRGRAYELMRRGIIPCTRLGRQIRISPEALAAFVANGGSRD